MDIRSDDCTVQGTNRKRIVRCATQAAEGLAEIRNSFRHFCRGTGRRSVFSAAATIERGLLRSARRLLMSLRKIAIPTPRAKARATKYQRVGNPRTRSERCPRRKAGQQIRHRRKAYAS